MSDLVEPVYNAKRHVLIKAKNYLTGIGIASRHTNPRQQEGLLKVARVESAKARQALLRFSGNGHIISAAEAAYFFCPTCDSALSTGTTYCSSCGTFVGDPHAV